MGFFDDTWGIMFSISDEFVSSVIDECKRVRGKLEYDTFSLRPGITRANVFFDKHTDYEEALKVTKHLKTKFQFGNVIGVTRR